MSSACYARSRGGFGFLSQRFHRLFATRPVRSETNKQFGGYVRCGGSGEHSRGFHPGGKTHSQEWLCHGQALEGGDQGWGLRASMKAKTVMSRASAASRPSRITVAMVSGSGVAQRPQVICLPAA